MTTGSNDQVSDVARSVEPEAQSASNAGETRRSALRQHLTLDRIEALIVVALYLLVTVTSFTTSSLGMKSLREQVSVAPETIGSPLPIRSDEWLTRTMVDTAVIANGHSSPPWFSMDPDITFQVSSGQPLERLYFFESNLLALGQWTPDWIDSMLFAASRAFPWLLLLLTLPRLLRRFGASRPLSWLGTILFAFAPLSAWYSWSPVLMGGFVAAGCYALVRSADFFADRRWLWGTATAGLAGLLLGRMATNYVPWQITIGLPLVTATVAYLLCRTGKARGGLLAVLAGAGIGGLALAGVFWENRDAIMATLNTDYPGSRRVTGEASDPWAHWGAPGLVGMQHDTPTILNQSELSTAYTLLTVWAAVLVWDAWAWMPRPIKAVVLTLFGWAALWMAWTSFFWGNFGGNIPVLNMVPAHRVAQTLGLTTGAVLLAIVASHVYSPRGVRGVLGGIGALVVMGLTMGAMVDMQTFLPRLSGWQIALTMMVVGAAIVVVSVWPRDWRPALVVSIAAIAAVATVNPLQFGLGDLRGSKAAKVAASIGERADAARVFVAADDPTLSMPFIANGAPMLTGSQGTGPRAKRWALIDPQDTYRHEWNRGVSYLTFSFTTAETAAVVTNPTPDTILVEANPCWVREQGVRLGYIVTRQPTNAWKCTTPVQKFRWGGATAYVYRVAAPS